MPALVAHEPGVTAETYLATVATPHGYLAGDQRAVRFCHNVLAVRATDKPTIG